MTERLPAFTVRPASADDAPVLSTLRSAMFQELGRHPVTGSQPAFEELAAAAFRAGLETGFCFAWLAEAADRLPLGSVALLVFPRLPSPDSPARQEGYLLSVYTAPESRGRGVATALVAAAVAKGRDLGLGRIRCTPLPRGGWCTPPLDLLPGLMRWNCAFDPVPATGLTRAMDQMRRGR
jgi:ribosomal protein S18 acetylase RimI-like enzyme